MVFVDLAKDEQLSPEYRAVNPEKVVPALIDGEGPALVQSLAILEYLEEQYPAPGILPKAPRDRAYVRALAHMVAVDAHPYIVPRLRKYLQKELGLDDAGWMRWLRYWVDSATGVVEEQLSRDARVGRFCCGDVPTIADICLVGHVTSAKVLYDCDLAPFPTVRRIFETCMQLDPFIEAHPLNQPDAPKAD
jgi:maleylacetoacetate isomerase/maleylpyruvate isomerase